MVEWRGYLLVKQENVYSFDLDDQNLVTELGAPQGCVRILEDNQGVVQLTHGQKDTSRSGHFRRPQVYVEDLVGQGFIWLDRTETDFNPADIFTKQVEPAKKFGYLRDVIMGIQPDMYLRERERQRHAERSRAERHERAAARNATSTRCCALNAFR